VGLPPQYPLLWFDGRSVDVWRLIAGLKLESEFPVQDLKSGQGGLLQVCMEGIGLLFANTKVQ